MCWLVRLSVCLSICTWPRLDFEGLENGEDGFLDKAKSWSRSIEDLHHTSNQPFCNTLVRSARQSVLRYVWLSQLPRCYLSLLLPCSANLECYKHVLACKPVVLVLFQFRIWFADVLWICCPRSWHEDAVLETETKVFDLSHYASLSVSGPPTSVMIRCAPALSSDESQLWAPAFVGQLWFFSSSLEMKRRKICQQ